MSKSHITSSVLLLLLLLVAPVAAMADAIGTWKLYPCYSDVKQIVPAGDDIFVLATNNLYSYNTTDNSLTEYNKTTCLTSSDITNIAWVQQAKRLVITYSDYSIDLLSLNQDVTNISDLANKQMTGDKTINDVYVNGKYAYISTGFGILKVNVSDAYIADTYNLGFKVDYCYIKGNFIYAESSEKGQMCANLSENLLDKNKWALVGGYAPKTTETYIQDTHNNCYWAADADSKLTKYNKQDDGTFIAASTGVKPEGPIKNSFWRLYKHDGKIFCTPGIVAAGMASKDVGCVQYYTPSTSTWTELQKPSDELLGTQYRMMNCMAFDPNNKNHFWVGGRSGLYEYNDYIATKAYNSTNSTLCPMYNKDTSCALICSMAYDNNHNLWVGNGWCDIALHCYQNDGTWKSFPQEGISYSTRSSIDQQGMMMSTSSNSMLWVNSYSMLPVLFEYSLTTNTVSNYQGFTYDDGSSAVIDYFYGLAEDKSNNLWIATSSGPAYIPKDQRQVNTVLTRHKVPRNDGTSYADYLLDGISIRCIKIDAANRKWMGTSSNGVYLISSDNNTQVYHFTSSDSPLLSDVIYDILIDSETGVVYFATDKGLCSFTADVTDDNSSEGEMTKDKVWAYPNPVTPEHTGYITIVGLTDGAQLKILTSSGQLVHEGICSGGSYQWNGCDQNGDKVASGIYMVNVATSDGNKGVVTKIAIVR